MKCYFCHKIWFASLLTILAVVSLYVFLAGHNYLWLVLALVEVALAAWSFWYRRRAGNLNLLSVLVRQEIERSCKTSPKSFFAQWIEQIYTPSWRSLVTVLIPILILSGLSHTPNAWWPHWGLSLGALNFKDSNHYQNLIAVLAGVGAIIFALIIFVAESLRDDETKDRARVLLRESMLFPLTVAEILVFLNFLWFDVNAWSAVLVFLVAISTIFCLWRLVNILLSKVLFYEKRLRLLKDRIEQSIDLGMNERYADNLLIQRLGESKIELSYNPFLMSDEEETHHSFSADTAGVIKDIRLDKLDEFAKLAESEANKNGFSFYKDKPRPPDLSAGDPATTPSSSATRNYTTVRQFLVKKYADRVEFKDRGESGNMVLLAVEKRSVTDKSVLKKLQKLAQEAFVIGKNDNFSEEINLELAGLKDQFIAAIVEKKLGKIDELRKTYLSLSESFLEMITRCGGGFSYDQAKQERGNLFGGQLNIGWLEDSIQDIVEKAIESRDREIISTVIYLPMAIATRAIKYGDQYLYQVFVRFPSRVYWLAKTTEGLESSLRDFMIDRSWRHLKEITDYYIENQLTRKIGDAKKLAEHADFSIPVFQTFQDLIKTAFDKRDRDSFKEFLSQLSTLYRHLIRDQEFSRYNDYDLESARTDEERKILQEKLDLQKARQDAAEKIQRRKQQLVFGMAAWIFEMVRLRQDDMDLRAYYDDIKTYLPHEIKELTALYSSARDFDVERFWNWNNWELIPDGEVHTIDFNSKLDRLYVVSALHLLRGITTENVGTIELPHNRDLAFLAEQRDGALWKMLTDIETTPANWEFALDTVELPKASILKTLLTKAKEAQEKDEEDRVRQTDIDPEKLAEFKKSLLDAFRDGSIIRSIITRVGTYIDRTDTANAEVKAYGYNQLDEKAAFIKNWHVHYSGWGENYGNGMASSESQIIFRDILEGLETKKIIPKNDIVPAIEKAVTALGAEDLIVIESLDHMFEYDGGIRKSEAFIPRWDHRDRPKFPFDEDRWCDGYFKIGEKYIPVFRVFTRDEDVKNFLVVASLKELGELVQYSPTDDPQDKTHREGIFELKVIDLNSDDVARSKLISQDPLWLREHQNKEGYLRRKVLINVYERVQFVFKNKAAAVKLFVSDIPTQEE